MHDFVCKNCVSYGRFWNFCSFVHIYLLLVFFCILPNTFLSGLCVRTPCLLIDLQWPTKKLKKNFFVMKGKNAMVIMEIKCKGCSSYISDCNRWYKTMSTLTWNTACSFWPEISSHLRLRNKISFLKKSSKKWQTNRDVYLQRSDMTQGAEEEWPQPSWLDPTWVLRSTLNQIILQITITILFILI